MIIISFSESQYKEATDINNDSSEDVFYCLGYNVKTGRKTEVLIRQVLNPYEFNVDRSLTHVEPDPKFICKFYSLARKEQADSIIQIHWHKFSDKPSFSSQDDSCAKLLLEDCEQFNPNIDIIQIVFGNNSLHYKTRFSNKGNFTYFNNLEIISSKGINILSSKQEKFSFKAQDIFKKNVLTFTKEGVNKISNTTVTMIGAGGIASGLLYMMSRIGFKHVKIIDYDIISADNCNRFYFITKPKTAIGKLKASFIEKAYKLFNPKAMIQAYNESALNKKVSRIIKNADLVILAVDNDAMRAVINSLCARYAKPMVNVASGITMNKEGNKIEDAACQIQWFKPREKDYSCLKCHGILDNKAIQQELMPETQKQNREKAGYIQNTSQSPSAQVMPLNGIAIGIAMWDIVSWIIGIKKPEPWLYYDTMQNKLISMKVTQNPECSCCSLNEKSILATGDHEYKLTIK